jgi:hypothetical protein
MSGILLVVSATAFFILSSPPALGLMKLFLPADSDQLQLDSWDRATIISSLSITAGAAPLIVNYIKHDWLKFLALAIVLFTTFFSIAYFTKRYLKQTIKNEEAPKWDI